MLHFMAIICVSWYFENKNSNVFLLNAYRLLSEMYKNIIKKNSLALCFGGRKWIILHTVHFLNYNTFVTCFKNCPG